MPPITGRIAIKLGNQRKGQSRYDSPLLGKTLSPLISRLRDLGFLDLNRSILRGEVSSIAPTPWFSTKVAEYGVALSEFGRDEAEEVIILTRNTRAPLSGSRKVYREPIDYSDTGQTRHWREELRAVNAFLAQADIDFLDDGLRPHVDPFDRVMRRRFLILPDQESRFDQGGRLFGGFWQTLKSSEGDTSASTESRWRSSTTDRCSPALPTQRSALPLHKAICTPSPALWGIGAGSSSP
jgi:hypothetical protein